MSLNSLLSKLGSHIEDAEEETFLLFSQDRPDSQNLGFVDSRASSITVSLGEQAEVTISQSPSLLHSSLRTGTTGAVLWRVSPLVASWMTQSDNLFFATGILHGKSAVLELGCGISGVIALAIAPRVGAYICTDQQYVLKQLRQNISENTGVVYRRGTEPQKMGKGGRRDTAKPAPSKHQRPSEVLCNVQVLELDWEITSLTSLATVLGSRAGDLDMLVACDCIYNSYLIAPFIQACVGVCRIREREPVICLVAQQLRSEEVFQEWLSAFMQEFKVWRVPDEVLIPSLRSREGYILHLGIIKSSATSLQR